MAENLLSINNLSINALDETGSQEIVKNLNLTVNDEQVVALVGGSGCGKTTTGLSILRLLSPAMKIISGEILFKGENILKWSERRMHQLRGKDIALISQEPLSAFNPVFTVGFQMDEVLMYHTQLRKKQRQDRIEELLEMVEILEPRRVARAYPHQLSGGMRQRVMIAMAISTNPRLVIADEPTSSLDVTLQARIIELFDKFRRELKLSILLITHDLGLVKHLADRVAVIYEGSIVDFGVPKEMMTSPKHPFTSELVNVFQS